MDTKQLKINTSHLVLMASVKDAPFKCPDCKKIFISESHLNRHKERRHNSKGNSPGHKGDLLNESTTGATIETVLNATERIEDLLFKLTLTPKLCNSLDCSSGRKLLDVASIVNVDSQYDSESFDVNQNNGGVSNENDVRVLNENDESVSSDEHPNENHKQLMKNEYCDFVQEKKKETLWRLTTDERLDSDHIDNEIVSMQNEIHESKLSSGTTTSNEETFTNGESFIDYRKRLKQEVIRKLNMRLESLGINYNQDRISDTEVLKIGKLLQKERDQIAKETPEYYKLRDLINVNAERRINENMQNKSVFIS